jgi:rod shape-determining protein MreC
MALQRRARSTRLLVITLVTLSLVTISVDYRQGSSGPLARVGRAALSILTPLQDGVTKAFRPIASFFSAVAELPSIKEERDRLRAEVKELQSQQTQITSVEQQNLQLRGLLALKQSLQLETTGANVIGSGVSNFEWSINIDKGSNDGVEVNMPIVAASGLVGRVVETSPFGSKVQLLIDPDAHVGARLVTSQETGVLTGRGPEDPLMTFVDANTPVDVGEAVETAGYEVKSGQGDIFSSFYPPGIPIGTVSKVSAGPADLSQTLEIRPAVDFSALSVVLVVLGQTSR